MELTSYQWGIMALGGGFGIGGFGFVVKAMIDKKIHNTLHQQDGTSTYVPRTVCKENHDAICKKLAAMHDDIKELMKRG